MTCTRYEKIAARHVAGELSSRHTRQFETHLAACPDCRRLIADHRQIRAALADLRRESAGLDVYAAIRAGVWQQLDAPPRPLPTKFRWAAGLHPAWAVAVLLLLVAGTAWLLRPTRPSTPGQQPGARTQARPDPGNSQPWINSGSLLAAKPFSPGRPPSAPSRRDSPRRQRPAPAVSDQSVPGMPTRAAADGPPANPIIPEVIQPATIKPPSSEDQLVIQLVTTDPAVAIVWLANPQGGNP